MRVEELPEPFARLGARGVRGERHQEGMAVHTHLKRAG